MWLYIICFLIFPLCILLQAKFEKADLNTWLSKERTDAIRGIAIATVMLHHVSAEVVGTLPYTFPFVQMGFAGVAIFFLLSGYAHVQVYGDKKLDSSFLWKKCKRMLLPFLVIWLLYFIAICIMGDLDTVNWMQCVKDVLYLKLPGTLCWYFKIQILLYILFYICFGILFRNSKITTKIGATTVAVLIYILIAYLFKLEPFWYITVIYFPLGLLLGYWKDQIYYVIEKKRILLLATSLILFGLMQGIAFFKGFGNYYYVMQMILTFFFVCICIFVVLNVNMKSICLKFMGNLSLELYLVHGVLLGAAAFNGWNFADGTDVILYFIVTIGISWLVHCVSEWLLKTFKIKGK